MHIATIRLESIRLVNELNAGGVGGAGEVSEVGGAGVARRGIQMRRPSVELSTKNAKRRMPMTSSSPGDWHWQSEAMAIGQSNALHGNALN